MKTKKQIENFYIRRPVIRPHLLTVWIATELNRHLLGRNFLPLALYTFVVHLYLVVSVYPQKLHTTTIKDTIQETEIINTTLCILRKDLSENDLKILQVCQSFLLFPDTPHVNPFLFN